MITLLKIVGICIFAFICLALYACVHVGKRGDRQKKWWEDDERC